MALSPDRMNSYQDIGERVRTAFRSNGDEAFADEYLKHLLSNWRSAEQTYRRTTYLLLVAVLAFELIRTGATSEGSVLGIKIEDLTLLQKALPAIIGYLLYRVAALRNYVTALRTVFEAIVKCLYDGIAPAGLIHYLEPYGGSEIEVIDVKVLRERSLQRRMFARLQRIAGYFVPALGFLYIGHAITELLTTLGPPDALSWIAAVTAAVLYIASILLVTGDVDP